MEQVIELIRTVNLEPIEFSKIFNGSDIGLWMFYIPLLLILALSTIVFVGVGGLKNKKNFGYNLGIYLGVVLAPILIGGTFIYFFLIRNGFLFKLLMNMMGGDV